MSWLSDEAWAALVQHLHVRTGVPRSRIAPLIDCGWTWGLA